MFKKIGEFIKSFFRNIAADPVSSLKGVVALAGAGATCYGMATGTVPINSLSIGAASSLATSGLHALGTDATGTTAPAVLQAEELVQSAAALTPTALTVSDHFQEIKKQAGAAQATLAVVSELSEALRNQAAVDRTVAGPGKTVADPGA